MTVFPTCAHGTRFKSIQTETDHIKEKHCCLAKVDIEDYSGKTSCQHH